MSRAPAAAPAAIADAAPALAPAPLPAEPATQAPAAAPGETMPADAADPTAEVVADARKKLEEIDKLMKDTAQ